MYIFSKNNNLSTILTDLAIGKPERGNAMKTSIALRRLSWNYLKSWSLLFGVVIFFGWISSGCGGGPGGTYRRIGKEEEAKRQLVEQIVPPELREKLPYRLDRWEAVGVSDAMMLEEVSRRRAMQDALVKLSVAMDVGVSGIMKDYIASHPVFTEMAEIDSQLSLSEVFYESASKVVTKNYMKGAIASLFWKDEHGLLGRRNQMYCYAYAPKYPELMELQALALAQEEMEKVRAMMLKRGLADATRERMNRLLGEIDSEVKEKESRTLNPFHPGILVR